MREVLFRGKQVRVYIVSLANHLSVVVNGYVYDTWNCTHKSVGNYWVIY